MGEFQLIDRNASEIVVRHRDQYLHIRGIIASAGFRRLIVADPWKARKDGVPKNNALRSIDQAVNGIFAFTDAPMCLCSFLQFGIAGLALIYAPFTFVSTLVMDMVTLAGTQTIIVALFFLLGRATHVQR